MIPRVTVLLPTFNGDRFLLQCIESVLTQSFRDFELLIVDDGSTDRSSDIYDAMARRDDRIRIFKQKNQGISKALNIGLSLAKGEFVARIDSDDLMLPTRLQAQVSFLASNEVIGFCASAMDIIDDNGIARAQYCGVPTSLSELDKLLRRKSLITYTHPTVMMRRQLAVDLGGYDKDFEPCEDTELFSRMISSGAPGLCLAEVLTQYRMHDGSISNRRALRQASVSELIRQNLYARLDGAPQMLPSHWDQHLQSKSFIERMRRSIRMRSQALQQMSRYEDVSGRPWTSKLKLLMAAGMRPKEAVRALIARFARSGKDEGAPAAKWVRMPR